VNTRVISPKIVRVTAAILEKNGKILIGKRKPEDELFGGLWEFPGGKIEESETPKECMARELKEELEIEVEVGELIISNKHKYPHGIFELLAYRVGHVSGDFVLNNHDEIKWVTVDEMSNFEFPPADAPIIKYLKNYND
jgi:8-oxo-dGTP diphosphatase